VIWADSAVVGAAFLGFSSWIKYALAYFAVFIESFEEFVVRPVDIFEVSVFRAVFGQYDLVVSFYDICDKSL
jgi:hypothetical protein